MDLNANSLTCKLIGWNSGSVLFEQPNPINFSFISFIYAAQTH